LADGLAEVEIAEADDLVVVAAIVWDFEYRHRERHCGAISAKCGGSQGGSGMGCGWGHWEALKLQILNSKFQGKGRNSRRIPLRSGLFPGI